MCAIDAVHSCIQQEALDVELGYHLSEELLLACIIKVQEVWVVPGLVCKFSPHLLRSGAGADHVLSFMEDLYRFFGVQMLLWRALIVPAQED